MWTELGVLLALAASFAAHCCLAALAGAAAFALYIRSKRPPPYDEFYLDPVEYEAIASGKQRIFLRPRAAPAGGGRHLAPGDHFRFYRHGAAGCHITCQAGAVVFYRDCAQAAGAGSSACAHFPGLEEAAEFWRGRRAARGEPELPGLRPEADFRHMAYAVFAQRRAGAHPCVPVERISLRQVVVRPSAV